VDKTMAVTTKQLYLEEMRDQGYSTDNIDDFHVKMIPYILEKYGVPKNGQLVEVGIAQGHCSISAYRAGYRNLAAVDYVDLNFTRFKAEYGIECFNVDITEQPIPFEDNSVDAFMFFHTIEHISSATLILSEMFRATKPGGKAFIVTPDWRKQVKTFFADPTHIKPYDKIALARLMRIAGWKKFDIRSFGTVFGMGRMKAFMIFPELAFLGPDILVVGRKE
jgi:ubiquinone/menaquinone biosynthesis C-methylase UbiE